MISYTKSYDIAYDIIYDGIFTVSCANDIVPKLWYHIWYQCCDIMYDITKSIIKYVSSAIFIEYCLRYHIHILWICPWYHYYAISYLILRMIYAIDIIITGYHSHTISHFLWYHMVPARRAGAGWGRQAPGAPPAPATPSPICWGRVFNWTVTTLMPCMDLLHWLLRAQCTAAESDGAASSSPSRFKFTGTLRTWMPITYTVTVLQLFKSY
jgi:hypothetical protein